MKMEIQQGLVFGLNIGDLLGIYNQDLQSWKTSELLLFEDSTQFLDRLPKSIMIANGKTLEPPMLEHLINVKEYGSSLIQMAQSRGVYLILNKLNNKFYVGSTKQNFIRRLKTHIRELERGNHHCLPLQRAFNKYGINNFLVLSFSIEEESRIEAEQRVIDNYEDLIYNTCKIAGCPNVILSQEAREKISKAMSERVISDEIKSKISKTLTGRKRGEKFSNQCSVRLKGKPLNIPSGKQFRGKKVKCINTEKIFNSGVEASRFLGLADNSVSKAIYRNRKTGGSFWTLV